MSQGVTYADLRFVRAPLENTAQPPPEGSGGGDLTYENLQAAKPQAANTLNSSRQHKAANKPFWPIATGLLLGASLFLLATTIGFGLRYRQASQHLLEASEASAAESSRLAQRSDAQERRLLQTQRWLEEVEAELNRSQAALRGSWQLGNSTRRQLREQEQALATATRGRLAAEEVLHATLAQACAGWCPGEWLLYGGKCLFSPQKKAWWESREDCQTKSAQLLIIPEVSAAIPKPLESNAYWTGHCQKWSEKERKQVWIWVDGSDDGRYYKCGMLEKGQLASVFSYNMHQYICEKPARPGGPNTLRR